MSGHDDLMLRVPRPRGRHPKNICCVGDDDQSIYGWRGAEVDNILRFDHDFPGAKIIRLERNYRSTGHILAAASHLIAHNEGRLGKTLRTEDVLGEKVQVTGGWDSEEEARAIGEEIEQLQREAREHGVDHPLDEIAILVRASFQMREFEDRFIQLGLPYRVIGGPRFYERMEIRDALAYLRVIAQPADDLAFERIVNVPKRGLGDATLQMLHDYARKETHPAHRSCRRALRHRRYEAETAAGAARPDGRIRALAREERFNAAHRARRNRARRKRLHRHVAERPFRRRRRPPGKPQGAGALHGGIREPARLPRAHLAGDGPRQRAEAEQAVNIMTLHSAKGLEFDCVFLPGWEEGLFPHQRSLDESGRAGPGGRAPPRACRPHARAQEAKIYFATNRRIHGMWTSTMPSRFLDELPEAHVEVKEAAGGAGGFGMSGYGASRFDEMNAFGSSYTTPGWQRARRAREAAVSTTTASRATCRTGCLMRVMGPTTVRQTLITSPQGGEVAPRARVRGQEHRAVVRAEPPHPSPLPAGEREREADDPRSSSKASWWPNPPAPTSSFTVGDRVFHQKFGNGNVVAVDGNKLTIAFDKAGEKRVVDSFVDKA